MDAIFGHIERVTFHNPENGFTVAKIKIKNLIEPVAIVGTMSALNPGETVECKGTWKHDPKHGKQFLVQSLEKKAPSSLLGIQKYLSSGLIRGIGPKYAEKIVENFGLDTLNVIQENPERLLEIEGLGKKKLHQIIESAKANKTIEEVMVFLQSHNITPTYAQKIFKRYGHECISILKENPYKLAQDIAGVGFKLADKVASSLQIEKDSSFRIAAGIEYLLTELSQNGHACYPKQELVDLCSSLLEIDPKLIDPVLFQLNAEKRIALDFIEKIEFVWLKSLSISEEGISKELFRIVDSPSKFRAVDIEAALNWVSKEIRIRFAKEQKEAISMALTEKLMIITGGPGTGKSTITRAILKILSKLSNRIVLAAPTGKAAKRMTEITYFSASTIHSLLEYDFRQRKFKRDGKNPLLADLLIIDEASMIDTYLMYQLLKAIPDSCRVIFIGDIDQLPSVGPGNVLRDMIDSEQIPKKRLKFIFRQGKGSKIISSAHSINNGFFPKLTSEKGDDFFFVESIEPEDVLGKIIELVQDKIPQKYHFDPKEDIQVLSPMRKGIIGTENLNMRLQEKLNPNKNAVLSYGRRFQVGDKVMQLKNNYNKEVFNGDVGEIKQISKEDQNLLIRYDGKDVPYEFSELDEINLAYAVSIHKYQGSESPCIVMPIHTHHFKLLCRNLLYTGVTRGKKLVILVGTKKALAIAIQNNEIEKRYTALKFRLTHQKALPS